MPRYPSLFQINTRVWLNQLSRSAGKPITLADIDDATFGGFADRGFDWVWLLSALKQTPTFPDGPWAQIDPQPAWSGDWTWNDFIAYAWAGDDGSRYLVAVNYAGNQGQCRLPLPFPEFRGKSVRLADVMGTEVYDRDGGEMVAPGLYVDHAPWCYNVFELRTI